MPDYKEMYFKLFRAQTKAIHILQAAQQETEKMYITAQPTKTFPVLLKSETMESPDENK